MSQSSTEQLTIFSANRMNICGSTENLRINNILRGVINMGMPKHKPSSHQKGCAKYQSENRLAKNKERRQKKHEKRLEHFAKRREKKQEAAN